MVPSLLLMWSDSSSNLIYRVFMESSFSLCFSTWFLFSSFNYLNLLCNKSLSCYLEFRIAFNLSISVVVRWSLLSYSWAFYSNYIKCTMLISIWVIFYLYESVSSYFYFNCLCNFSISEDKINILLSESCNFYSKIFYYS